MNSPTLSQQILRDLRRNPKKAGLLALLAGVAIWFWAPLVAGCFKGEDVVNALADQATLTPVASPVVATPEGAKADAAKVAEAATQTWQQLVRWMDQDPRRKADDIPLERDPFAPPPKPKPKPAAERSKVATAVPAHPEKIGLKLTGTLLGGERRLALINGRPYAEGQAIKAADTVFVVRRVEARKVTLEL